MSPVPGVKTPLGSVLGRFCPPAEPQRGSRSRTRALSLAQSCSRLLLSPRVCRGGGGYLGCHSHLAGLEHVTCSCVSALLRAASSSRASSVSSVLSHSSR